MMIPNANDVDALESSANHGNSNGFICGVVEGFYGLPWTMDQRRKLFARMSSLGMNTYIYAPKDDLKHRMHWRDLYTVDEAEPLTTLIESARDHGVTFVYALSPGLDITYSSTKDMSCLKHKLEQVASFGCEAFALLFDDIDVELCDSDRSLYQSFAAAQVSVTNEAYQHLRQPLRFFFCPTEYCASRAVPSVTQSEYLNTVGAKLLPDIEVMWTGPKVISKRITVHSIEEVGRVLRRRPLIWDNLHANDYDSKRLFLGPYDGRSPRLVPHLRGVLTNPNCEFESDFVALHTLAQWSRASDDGGKKDLAFNSGAANADIRLETEGSSGSNSSTDDDDDLSESTDNSPVEYTPRQALRRAITAWLPEFSMMTPPPIASLQRKVAAAAAIPSPIIPTYLPTISGTSSNKAVDQMALLEVADGYVQPVPAAVTTNSLIRDEPLSESSETSSTVADAEPMDCIVTSSGGGGSTPTARDLIATSVDEGTVTSNGVDGSDNNVIVRRSGGSSGSDSVIATPPPVSMEKMQIDGESSSSSPATASAITADDIATIVDMFYLPFEHGPRAARLLQDFFWIKTHAVEALSDAPLPPLDGADSGGLLVGSSCCNDCDQSSDIVAVQPDDWHEQVRTFLIRLRWVSDVIDRVLAIPNRALAFELFPYLWDIKAALFLLDSFVQWLGANKFYREQLICRDQEPWLFRGGLLGEIQRMLPFESAPDLLFYPYPAGPQASMYRIRPYKPTDKDAIYKVCLQTYSDGADGSQTFSSYPDLCGDKFVGPFLAYSANNCFVVVDNQDSVCGYAVAVLDALSFNKTVTANWIPFVAQKYPLPSPESTKTEHNPATQIITSFHRLPSSRPAATPDRYPSLIRIDVMRPCRDGTLGDPSAVKRALACAAITLKVTGSKGVHTVVDAKHTNTIETYRTLGFVDVPAAATDCSDDCLDGVVIMGRPV